MSNKATKETEYVEPTANVATVVETKPTRKVRITDGVSVAVESCFSGKLIFKNRKTGEKVKWNDKGRSQDMTISDLKDMRATQIGFFENQWIKILGGVDDDGNEFTSAEIIKHLRIENFYKQFVDPNNFDELCKLPTKDIAARVAQLSDGAKTNLAVSLRGYVQNGKLDSLAKIKAFENALGCSIALD